MRFARSDLLPEARRILRLAWPVMLTSLNWTLMHLIDVAVVGHYGTAELGQLGAGRAITFITIVMGMAGMAGVLVFTARADGARDRPATGDYLRQGLILGLAIGLPAMLLLLGFARPMVVAAQIAPAMVDGGAAVVRAMALAYPFQFVLCAASYFLEGVSRPRRVMVVNLAMLPANALLAWAWVGGHFGLPALGAVGAVLATATVSAAGAAGMVIACWTIDGARERGVRDLSAAAWSRSLAHVPALARFGALPALAAGLELAGFSWLIALSTQLGTIATAAFQTVFSLHNFIFALALGFGSAAGVRAGNAVGAGEPHLALPRTLIAAALALVVMAAGGGVLFAAAPLIVRPFSDDPAVLAVAVGLLLLMAPFIWLDGLQVVFVYALRSLGDQVAAGINGIVAFFLVTGVGGWWMVRAGLGASSLAYAIVAGITVAALLQGGRLWLVDRRIVAGSFNPAGQSSG